MKTRSEKLTIRAMRKHTRRVSKAEVTYIVRRLGKGIEVTA